MNDNMTINYNFEWDPNKANENQNKHAVTFDEAATVFKDSKALSIYDTDHSEDEGRWLTLGISEKGRLMVVARTFREEGDDSAIIRIISSRKATKQELNTYGV
jgi:hypothetical protein